MTQAKQILYSPVEIEDADFVDFERDPKMEEENAEFEKFRSEMHDAQYDAKITVSKKLTDSAGRPLGRQVFECFECGVDDYTFSQLCTRIREDFGTGLYQIHGRDSKGKYKFKKTVGILAPNPTDNSPVGLDVGGLIDKFSAAMERQQARTEAMFKSLVGPQTGGEGMKQMTEMISAMGVMMGAMGIKPQPQTPQKTFAESLQEFVLIKELIGSSGGEGGGDANLYSLLTATVQNFGPLLGAALSSGQKDGTVSPTGIIQGDASSEVPKLPFQIEEKVVGDASQSNPDKERLEAMKPQLQFLLSQAQGGAKPNDVADFVMKAIPENQLEAMEDFLLFEDCTDLCVQVLPGLGEFKEWFEQWQTEMLDRLQAILESETSDIVAPDDTPSIIQEPEKKTELETPLEKKTAEKVAKKASKTRKSAGQKNLTDESSKAHDSPTVTGDGSQADSDGKPAIASEPKRKADGGT